MIFMIAFVYWSAIVLLLLPTLVSSEDPVNFHHDIDDNTVTVGHEHACALEDVGSSYGIGGEIICWGDGTFGQLDSPPGIFVQISASEHRTCGIRIDEAIVCWGSAGRSTIANKNTGFEGERFINMFDPNDPDFFNEGEPPESEFFLLRKRPPLSNTELEYYATQLPDEHGDMNSPQHVPRRKIRDQSNARVPHDAFEDHSKTTGTPQPGRRRLEMLSRHRTGQQIEPATKEQLEKSLGVGEAFLQVSTGTSFACALTITGKIFCWGNLEFAHFYSPMGQFAQVSCGDGSCCALCNKGKVHCWGDNRGGVISFSPHSDASARVATLPHWKRPQFFVENPPERFLQISVSQDNTACGIAAKTYALMCWGSFFGSHGGSSIWDSDVFLQVATGDSIFCGVKGDGVLYCIGEERKLWRGPKRNHKFDRLNLVPPKPPAKDTAFLEISAHGVNVCGITAEFPKRRILCWGESPLISMVPDDLVPAGISEVHWTGGDDYVEPDMHEAPQGSQTDLPRDEL